MKISDITEGKFKEVYNAIYGNDGRPVDPLTRGRLHDQKRDMQSAQSGSTDQSLGDGTPVKVRHRKYFMSNDGGNTSKVRY